MWVLETIPDSKSLHWVAEILIYGGLWKTIRLPHLMFLLQVEALIAALSIQMLYVYGHDQPAGWAFISLGGLLAIGGPRVAEFDLHAKHEEYTRRQFAEWFEAMKSENGQAYIPANAPTLTHTECVCVPTLTKPCRLRRKRSFPASELSRDSLSRSA